MLLTTSPSAWGQGETHEWSHRFGGDGADRGTSIAVDGAGNVLVTGHFRGAVDFDGWWLNSAGQADVFVAKFDSTGRRIWCQRFGDSYSDNGNGISVDEAGNVLVTGHFCGTVDFGGDPLSSEGEADIFMAKFDASGSHLWSRRMGGIGSEAGLAVAQDETGGVFLTGWFTRTVDFGGERMTSAGQEDVFVARYDAEGKHIWSRRFGGTGSDAGEGIATDGTGAFVVTGHFSDTVDFGGGAWQAVGSSDVFVAKFDAEGTHLWSRRVGGSDTDDGWGIATDGEDCVVVTGSFKGAADLGGRVLQSAGQSDIFVAKYDPTGTHLWSRSMGGLDEDDGWGIATDNADNILVTGRFRGSVDFGGGRLRTRSDSDIFLATYDATGEHLSSARFCVTGVGQGLGVGVGGRSILLTGHFDELVDFGGGLLIASGGDDVFVAKFSAPPTTLRPVSRKSDRGGFTLLVTMGVGWQHNGFIDETESGPGMNLGIGGFAEDDLALMLRYSSAGESPPDSDWDLFSSRSLPTDSGFLGVSGQGWITNRFTLELGVGTRWVRTGRRTCAPFFGCTDETRSGLAVLVAAGYSLILSGKHSFQVGFEYTPAFVEETHHAISFNVGWQLL